MAKNQDEKMKQITDRLQEGLQELFDSERYAEYLRVMSKFHRYSVNNTLLIAMQKPDATLVAGYQAWQKKFNRHVNKGERGIQIIAPAPIREKREQEKIDPETGEVVLLENGQPETEEVTVTIPRFTVSTVFDVSQTDGDPLPDLAAEELTANVENFDIFMEAINAVSPVPIRFDEIQGEAKGYYHLENKEIVIQQGMPELQTMKTAVHETAHAILHDKDVMQEQGILKDRMTKECEAESVAFCVLSYFGLDTDDYSFPYIAGWSSSREMKEVRGSLDTIRRTSSEIIDGIENSMREQMLERQEQEAELPQEIENAERDKMQSEKFEEVTLFDVPMLFSNGRVDRDSLPDEVYCYDMRGADYDPGKPLAIEDYVAVNHAASIISAFPLDLSEQGRLRLGEELNFGDGEITLAQYMEEVQGLDPKVQEERLENAIGYANENLFLDGKEDRYAIYQLKEGEDYHDLRFVNTEYLANHDLAVEGDNYNYIYGGRLPEGETLDGIYERFNLHHPETYTGHSLSVSDMVILQRDGEARAYYVDSFGFAEIEDFVEQRQKIAERQHRIEDACINYDTLGVIVDGHEGTWQAIADKEINGEMFYLMESQEYGNTVANILLHMDGDLVAEDLWNGIDFNAMRGVREYFDRSGIPYSKLDFPLQERYSIDTVVGESEATGFVIMDHVTGHYVIENGVAQIYDDRAELAEIVDYMNQSNRSRYRETVDYAREHGELATYRASMQENRACKEGIEQIIRDNFDGMYLNQGVLKPVVDRFGAERTAYVLANTVQYADWDQRYSRSNKEWAASIMEGEDLGERRTSFLLESHPAILDGFVGMFRKEYKELEVTQEKTELAVEVMDENTEEIGQTKEGITSQIKETAVRTENGYFTIQETEGGYDYSFYDETYHLKDGGVLENPDISIQEAMKEILSSEGIDLEKTEWADCEQIIHAVEQAAQILPIPEFVEKEPALTFYVAECMEFPVLGEYHENLTLQEAVEIYEKIPDDRMSAGKGIGFNLDDGSDYAGEYGLMQGGKVYSDLVDMVQYYKENPLVQQALAEIKKIYPDARDEVRQQEETQKSEPEITQKAGEVVSDEREFKEAKEPVSKEQGVTQPEKEPEKSAEVKATQNSGRKESVLKALRERQAQIKERDQKTSEQKKQERKKGEQSL